MVRSALTAPRAPRAFPRRFIPALLWLSTSLVVVGSLGLLYSRALDAEGVAQWMRVGPLSTPDVTILSLVAIWFVLGGLVLRIARRKLAASDVLTLVCALVLGLLYANVLRERTEYGDIGDFVRAAQNLDRGQHLHARYLYPPLWATVLQPLVPLGARGILDVCWALNFVSFLAFFPLLVAALRDYGFAPALATLTAFAFTLVNTPILRTLFYVQTNLHVMNLVLIALLWRRKHALGSALALALAINLKSSPLILLPAFVLGLGFRWSAWFVAAMTAIFVVTVRLNGLGPYADFAYNLGHIYEANGLAFRDSSFDSFVHALAGPTGLSAWFQVALILAAKVALIAVCVRIGVGWGRTRPFAGAARTASTRPRPLTHQLLPPLLILMMMLSPLVWEHHPVFVALPFLLMLQLLETPAEWTWFGAAYLLEFLLPTFDFFPWSYGRLLGVVIWAGLAWRFAQGGRLPSERFARANAWATTLAPSA
jgi:hypothetical protein